MNDKKFYNRFEDFIGAWMLLFMCIATFINVISRYVLHSTISASEEIVTLLFVLLSLFGSAVAAKRRAHLGLTILTDNLPWKVNKYISAFGYIISAIFCVILTVEGVKMVQTSLRFNTVTLAMNWPEWIFNSFVPIGAVVIGIRYLQMAVITLRRKNDFGHDEEEAAE